MEILLKIEEDSKLSKFFRYLNQEQREKVIKRILQDSFNSKLELKKPSELSVLNELRDRFIVNDNILIVPNKIEDVGAFELKDKDVDVDVDKDKNSGNTTVINSILLDSSDEDDDGMLFDLVK